MPSFTDGRNSKVTWVVNFILSKFGSLPQGFLKVVLHTGLNVSRGSSGGSRFVTVSWCDIVTNKIYFMHWFDIPSPSHLSKCAQYQLETTCTIVNNLLIS